MAEHLWLFSVKVGWLNNDLSFPKAHLGLQDQIKTCPRNDRRVLPDNTSESHIDLARKAKYSHIKLLLAKITSFF